MQQERGRRHSRAQHLRGVFGPWWAIVNGIWALLSSADTLVGHYASVAARAKWDAAWIAPKWGWKAWLVGFCVITTVFGIEASYQFCKKWERDHYVPPELAIDIKELCVQPLIHFEQKQLRDWLTRWKIGASVADTMKPLLESGDDKALEPFRPLLSDLFVHCDVFVRLKLTPDYSPLEVDEYRLTAALDGAETHVAWFKGDMHSWSLKTEVGNGVTHFHHVPELPDLLEPGRPTEGWLHFLSYDTLYSRRKEVVYRLHVKGSDFYKMAEVSGSDNVLKPGRMFRRDKGISS